MGGDFIRGSKTRNDWRRGLKGNNRTDVAKAHKLKNISDFGGSKWPISTLLTTVARCFNRRLPGLQLISLYLSLPLHASHPRAITCWRKLKCLIVNTHSLVRSSEMVKTTSVARFPNAPWGFSWFLPQSKHMRFKLTGASKWPLRDW